MIDLACSFALFSVCAVVAAFYAIRVLHAGRARSVRIDKEGGGPLVGRRPMEMMYWALGPVGRACAALHISAAAVTWASLVVGVAAGIALAAGYRGLAALLATVGFLGDAIDGMVARMVGTASDRGELLDAAVDRYVELVLFGGLLVLGRASVPFIVITFAALTASVMVSYVTAKAEALGVNAPRGMMRRTERATLITLGLALAPVVAWFDPRLVDVPIAAALVGVGILGNVSSVSRLSAMSEALRLRVAPPSASGSASSEPDVAAGGSAAPTAPMAAAPSNSVSL